MGCSWCRADTNVSCWIFFSRLEMQFADRENTLMSALEIQIVGRVEGSLGSEIRRRLKAACSLVFAPNILIIITTTTIITSGITIITGVIIGITINNIIINYQSLLVIILVYIIILRQFDFADISSKDLRN